MGVWMRPENTKQINYVEVYLFWTDMAHISAFCAYLQQLIDGTTHYWFHLQ